MKLKLRSHQSQSGQALVVLLVFITVATMVIYAATLLSVYSLTSASSSERTEVAVDVAESGMENAILRLLRDPFYAGETLTLPDGTATITVSGTTTKTIVSVGKVGNFTRSVTASVTTTNGILTLSSWTDSF